MKIKFLVLGFFCCVTSALTGCSLKDVPVTITSYNNPYLTAGNYQRFTLEPLDDAQLTTGKHLQEQTKILLEERGFIFDSTAPQFTVYVQSGDEPVTALDSAAPKAVSRKVLMVFGDLLTDTQTRIQKLLWQGEAVATYEIGKVDLETCLIYGLIQSYPGKQNAVTRPVKAKLCRTDR